MLISNLMTVILLNDLIHEWSEGIIRVVGSGINTDSGGGPLGSREDTLLEGESELVSSVFALLPNILGQAFRKKG